MSFSHHELPRGDSELRKLFAEQQARTAQRQWPQGRIAGSDDGEVAFVIGSDVEKQLVGIQFPTPIAWLAMSPQEAVEFAQRLIKNARAISKEPIRVIIN